MSYSVNTSDVEQDGGKVSDFRPSHNRSSGNLAAKALAGSKLADHLWTEKLQRQQQHRDDDTDSEISDSGNFLAKGAFLLTPSHELSMERAALICEKMNFKGCFSLTKTATGILFKFSSPEDYLAVFKKGFHKVTGARFYRKVAIPCRPQKTFTLFVLDVPEDLPVDDIRHSLYRFNSVVEVVRLVVHFPGDKAADGNGTASASLLSPPKVSASASSAASAASKLPAGAQSSIAREEEISLPSARDTPAAPVRITLASLDEYNALLQNGLDFYGATFFPTESNLPQLTAAKIATRRGR